MRLCVIGPETSVGVIRQVVERDLPDIRLTLCCSDFYEDSADMAKQVQSRREADAILFTGPTNYAYARKRVTPDIPWGFLPHNRTSAIQALFEAAAVYQSDLRALSVDRYGEDLIREALESAGIRDAAIFRAPYGEEEPDFEKKLLEFHRRSYREGKAAVCITSMEHIHAPLLEEGVPCVRVRPAKEVIHEQIYRLQLLHLSAMEHQGHLAVVAARFDYILDDERDLPLREWEEMRWQNQFKERVYAVGQQLEAAVFEAGTDHFYLVTTRNMLQNVFLKNREYAQLLEFGRKSERYRVWLGMGIGSTMLEARSRAAIALNQAVADRPGASYLMENEYGPSGPLEISDSAAEDRSAQRLAERTGLSMETLQRLAQALEGGSNHVTAEELAQRLGITSRSINRILVRLEEAGCVNIVGKQSARKGRPARVMKITLPVLLNQPPTE